MPKNLPDILRYFRSGPLNRKVIKISLPALLTMISHTVVMITDTAMVGRINTDSIAATGLGGFFIYTVISLFMGVSLAIQIITARRIGEKNFLSAKRILFVSLFWVILLSGLFSVFGWVYANEITALFVSEQNISRLVSDYLSYRFLGIIFYALVFVFRGFFDGIGMTFVGMASAIITTFMNVFLNWVLIYGNLGAEAMGVKGASIASSLAAVPGVLVFLAFLLHPRIRKIFAAVNMGDAEKTSGKVINTAIETNAKKVETGEKGNSSDTPGHRHNIEKRFSYTKGKLRSFKDLTKELAEVGFPVALEELLLHVSFLFFYKIAAGLGAVTMASTNILISVISLSFMPGMAFGVAATTMLGQAMGAMKFKLARIATHRAALFAAIVMGSMGIIFIIFGKSILRIFTTEKLVLDDAYTGLVIVSLIQVADAIHMVYGAALRGAGMVYKVLAYYFVTSYFIMLPIAYLLGVICKMGTTGLWISISFWIVLLAFNFFRIFKKGDWQGYEV